MNQKLPVYADRSELYRRVRHRVDRVIQLTLGGDSERRDVAQDVFVEILRAAATIRDPACLESWAATIAVYAVRKELRRRRRRRLVLSYTFDDDLLYCEPTNDSELAIGVTRALDKLRRDECEILIRRLLHGCSMRELASDLGCSVSTARRRLKQARERLLSRLGKSRRMLESCPTARTASGHA
jgi:RNA polymerase sigma factor (sigma-70 family)